MCKGFLKRSAFIFGVWRTLQGGMNDVRVIIWTIRRKRQISDYLKREQPKKLHLGASNSPLPGWLNSDVSPTKGSMVYLNATRRFPMDDNAFDYVMAEHMIEHITYDAAVMMLRECHRVLKPGGKIRISTPDLEVLIGLHSVEKTELQKRYIDWSVNESKLNASTCKDVFVINNFFHAWGHCFLYDRATFKATMEAAGFVHVMFYKPGVSEDHNLEGIESHGKVVSEEINQFETFVAEAVCQKSL
jgi:predicted SAM-dependent methyltransferase